MYKLNLFPAALTEKQKEELFNKQSFDKLMKILNEEKKSEQVKSLEEVLEEKLNDVYVKSLMLNEKAEIYSLADKDETLKNMIDAIYQVEIQLDDSLESFTKVEDAISKAWERMRAQILENWHHL